SPDSLKKVMEVLRNYEPISGQPIHKKKNSYYMYSKTSPPGQWASATLVRNPPTIKSGSQSLLYKISLTRSPPLYDPRNPGLRLSHMGQLSTWRGQSSILLA
ncbi:hypothetical protein HAX54_007238, partial [Datura stramonium]|nr:hypothetical protein [Datura stramonium]